MAKTAIEKLNVDKQPHVTMDIPPTYAAARGARSMLISTPREIDGVMRRVPKGRLITFDELRAFLARRHNADITCPLTTGIFVNIVARAAEEMRALGETEITAWWRTLKPGGVLNDKFPGGAEGQKARLEAEGFVVVKERSHYRVADFAERLWKMPSL
jgi:alkylated DNA nucleotide flippase Atl1